MLCAPRHILRMVLIMTGMGLASAGAGAQLPSETVTINAGDRASQFPHFWEQAFGSGRAILTLRESYRNDLREVKKATGFSYVRFHNIFHDEVGVYDEDEAGNPIYNFSYVDQIYDGLLANGVRPLVEISFMPRKLALRQDVHPFWYKQIVSPPKDYSKWDGLVRAFGSHLVERYGMDEVAQWYFEVWNEPNIDFWTGEPKQTTYFELYDHTARALKAVSSRLRVGGPATSSAHWVDDFLRHAAMVDVPVDFVSSHGYADDTVEDLFGTHDEIPMDQRLCRAVRKIHDQIANSPRPYVPLFWTEWNVPSFGPLQARDTPYVGAALADDIWQCDGLVTMLSFWTLSDVFEENGPKTEPFDGGFGLIALGGIKKPSFHAFALLHRLGDQRLPNSSKDTLVTRRADGTIVIATWNLVDPDRKGSSKSVAFAFQGVSPNASVFVSRVDLANGNTLAIYEALGRPRYPTTAQVRELNSRSQPAPPQPHQLKAGSFTLEVPVNGLVLLEIPAVASHP